MNENERLQRLAFLKAELLKMESLKINSSFSKLFQESSENGEIPIQSLKKDCEKGIFIIENYKLIMSYKLHLN